MLNLGVSVPIESEVSEEKVRMQSEAATTKSSRLSLACPWLKRLGMVGFVFFLAKGLLWLLVPGLLAYFGLK